MRKNLIIPLTFIILAFSAGNITGYYLNTDEPQIISENNKNNTLKEDNSSFWDFNKTSQADLKTFWNVWDVLDTLYYDPTKLNTDQRIYGAIKGMVSSLGDPYTVYMTPDETKEFQQSLEGKLEGIGAELTVKEGNLVVVSPIKSSPANKAGLKPGDIIYLIDGNATSEMTLFEAITKIRGPKGSKVVLTIIRQDKPQPFEVTIIRETIDIPSVEAEYRDNIAIITVNQFNEVTLPEFNKVEGDILMKQPKGIIVDLRYNGGGYLDTSIKLLSKFFENKEKAVIIKQKENNKNEIIYTFGKGKLSNYPLVVLINQGSASASEIFAGAIQDLKRGILIGEQSHGKGSVQQIEELKDGSSLRITIAKWFTPLDRSIDEVGIQPDRIVKQNEDEKTTEPEDAQLNEAISYIKSQASQLD
ncbi:hypothetical protein A2483_02630 [Candidatus Peregrinibacteria bacterium RIFOXYC2_FULL_33_13]|nr:MAG: Carboxyl-terminal protease [Candidatus Peregrinibacteria bacterium GW2011_GWA2_33_10]KKP40106.1 MAG: carboxy-terminal-processing protease, carboxyl-terminal processing protease [Candidatus Peregrinibacteria bacterium GW2011_GWC2_33_13]OGJ49826.1 MAG: hypothetical protein A2229_05265 [Candidatus Peregrinibacteria bacterium RIFOXYA2_FULL_33_7]OGJ54456.1 MAG: hypothetical protein A2483_02630 [Candidatus Peregrinibacteria bacterium RIFOXYC2_FULL_33_13]